MTSTTTPGTRATFLNQIIAVRTSVKNDVRDQLTKDYHLLQKPALLAGHSRTYTPQADDGFRYPPESANVQVKVEKVLRDVAEQMTKLFDITAALDWSNQHARADVVLVTGDTPVTLLLDVPVSYLMFLEKQLVDLETMIRRLPVLDASETWTYDPNTDIYKTEPVGTTKTTKVRRNHVLSPATDRHPAQVESFTEDIPVGTWSTVKFSGALPAQRVNKMLGRVTALAQAVKYAREQANMEEVLDPKPGRRIFEYLFAADEV